VLDSNTLDSQLRRRRWGKPHHHGENDFRSVLDATDSSWAFFCSVLSEKNSTNAVVNRELFHKSKKGGRERISFTPIAAPVNKQIYKDLDITDHSD
jgi:hypothetical protein